MARARNIKPGFFRNADLVELPMEARLLFIGLWTLADRAGRLEDRPKQIKMDVFPADGVDCGALLDQLAATGMIERYEVNGAKYLQVVNFAKHQNPHRDEKASTLPDRDGNVADIEVAPTKHRASTVQAPCKTDAATVAIGLIPDFLIPDPLIPDSLLMNTPPQASAPIRKKAKTAKTQIPEDFEISERVRVWAAKGGFTMLEQHLDAFSRKCKAKAYENVSWDDAFMEAIREDWAKLRGRVANGSAPPADHASADELETRSAIEKQAFDKGLDSWNSLDEQWPAYKTRVLRAPRLPSMSLEKLGELAKQRQGVTA